MATVAAIRSGLETRLKSISNLRHVYRRWPSQADFPCVIIGRGTMEPEQTFGRGDLTRYLFELYLLAPLTPGYEAAQDKIDPFLATSSTGGIYGAIHADRTLGGAVQNTFVTSVADDEQFDLGDGREVIGAIVNLEIWAS